MFPFRAGQELPPRGVDRKFRSMVDIRHLQI
jgi:hypothetical protein